MTNKPNVPVLVGAGIAALLSLIVLGFGITLVLALVAGGVYFYLQRGKGGPTPPPTQTFAASPAVVADAYLAEPTSSESLQDVAPDVPALAPTTAAEAINLIRNDCVQEGFFLNHQVKSSKDRRTQSETVKMTATTRTNKNFLVEVSAVQTPYGTHLSYSLLTKGGGVVSGVMQQSSGFGGAFARGAAAGKQRVLESKQTELNMELKAFEQRVFDKYDHH